jgi:hypothetical protein
VFFWIHLALLGGIVSVLVERLMLGHIVAAAIALCLCFVSVGFALDAWRKWRYPRG